MDQEMIFGSQKQKFKKIIKLECVRAIRGAMRAGVPISENPIKILLLQLKHHVPT